MTRILMRALGLMGVYLLVLTSLAPGDILVGAVLGLAVALTLRPEGFSPSPDRLAKAAAIAATTVAEVVRGSWRVVRFCVVGSGTPGFVEIPRGERSDHNVAMWGVLTGLAPDELPVDVDDDRDVLIVHLVDASDPEAVRARHARDYERLHRGMVP